MYLPRLRARRHELLAIRKCASTLASSRRVFPLIEPVKPLDGLLASRLNQVSGLGLSCTLVLNPSVGAVAGLADWEANGDYYMANGLLRSHGLAILSNANADHGAMSSWVDAARRIQPFAVDIVHEPGLSTALRGTSYRDIRWNVAEDRTVPSSYGLPLGSKPVVWASDPFPGLQPNSEYLSQPESIFTTRASTYRSAGYAGISDFLTIGRLFQAGGGPAYAVVIHLTFDSNGSIRIRHFCSDSNATRDDPGGKFLEALDKLARFVQASGVPSNLATTELLDLHRRQHFPGLGKVKEISMMNHMLVMMNAV